VDNENDQPSIGGPDDQLTPGNLRSFFDPTRGSFATRALKLAIFVIVILIGVVFVFVDGQH
jgi:hypothetical protein